MVCVLSLKCPVCAPGRQVRRDAAGEEGSREDGERACPIQARQAPTHPTTLSDLCAVGG